MGEVNLHELALKSIEQYATLGVRLASLEQALTENNRRFEQSQDKFIAACDKLSRMEEKLLSYGEDRAIIHRRIDDTRAEVDKLVNLVKKLTGSMKDHQDDHCGDCPNAPRIDAIEKGLEDVGDKLETYTNGDKDLVEAKQKMTSPQGMMFIRFVSSKWGLAWMSAVSVSVLISFFSHYDFIKFLWDKITLNG